MSVALIQALLCGMLNSAHAKYVCLAAGLRAGTSRDTRVRATRRQTLDGSAARNKATTVYLRHDADAEIVASLQRRGPFESRTMHRQHARRASHLHLVASCTEKNFAGARFFLTPKCRESIPSLAVREHLSVSCQVARENRQRRRWQHSHTSRLAASGSKDRGEAGRQKATEEGTLQASPLLHSAPHSLFATRLCDHQRQL